MERTTDEGEGVKPEALFKYLSPGRISVLRDLLVRFTQASSLNDTLELRPPIKGVAEHKELERIAREGLAPALWSQTSAENKEKLDRFFPGLTDQLGEQFLQEYTQKCVSAIERRHEQNPNAVFEKTDQNFGILSLTEDPSDIRMWGHYGDGGRGFLIEFDPSHAWFHGKREERDSFRHIRKVQYVAARPLKFLLDTTELDFLYTKWDVWQEEREWRIIRCFNDAQVKLEKPDPYGNEILLFAIPPDAIRSVIIGFSAKPEFEEEMRSILASDRSLSHVVLKRAAQSLETGRISIAAMNDTVTVD